MQESGFQRLRLLHLLHTINSMLLPCSPGLTIMNVHTNTTAAAAWAPKVACRGTQAQGLGQEGDVLHSSGGC